MIKSYIYEYFYDYFKTKFTIKLNFCANKNNKYYCELTIITL